MATDKKPASAGKGQIQAVYSYRNEAGEIVYEVLRYQPKNFKQRRPVGEVYALALAAGWYRQSMPGGDYYLVADAAADPNKSPAEGAIWLEKVEPILYSLPLVLKAIEKGETIFIAEGEKDVDRLLHLGYTATTNSMGAGKWRDTYTQTLKGCKSAVIIADRDKDGRKHAETIARELSGIGIKVRVIEMPDRNGAKVKDFHDWTSAGGTREEFNAIITNTPVWQEKVDEKVPTESQAISDSLSPDLVDQYGEPFYTNKEGEAVAINEAFFAALHYRENIELYDPEEGAFYRYVDANGLYEKTSEHIIKKEIADRILHISREQDLVSLERQKKNSILVNIVANLKGIAEKKDAFAKKAPFVHVANGVIEFKETGEADFVGFSPKFYSRNQSPISYDPNAKCDRFHNELLYRAVSAEDALTLQKYAGQCLLGNNLMQKFAILDGPAKTGKTTLSSIFQSLVGRKNVTQLRTKYLADRFETFRYIKTPLLVGVDVPGQFLSERGAYVIKALVGGDTFDPEQKCCTGSFQMEGKFCIIITSNSRLQVKLEGDLEAWKRRLLIIRFEAAPIVKTIPEFADLLIREEGPGILNWALQGISMLLTDIRENNGNIRLDPVQIARIDALLAESDSVRHYLNDRIVTDVLSDAASSELAEDYAAYCPTKGWYPKPITVFYRELDSLMLELFHTAKSHSISRDGKSVRGYHRVRLQDNLENAK